MAHVVRVTTPHQELRKTPVVFIVLSNGGKFGELQVGKRGLRWWRYHGKKHELIRWENLDSRLSRDSIEAKDR